LRAIGHPPGFAQAKRKQRANAKDQLPHEAITMSDCNPTTNESEMKREMNSGRSTLLPIGE
jgi:hypothetical protein